MVNSENKRPLFPKRAVITAGMPYGNKELHFGHIGGVFVQADIFARFLRDRIGKDNVIFVSGTDCYGGTIETGYEQAVADGFEGSIEDYVSKNHQSQKETLDQYQISLNLYATSALGEAGKIHAALSAEVFNRLHQQGVLQLRETMQFFDEEKNVFLNGRQVTGYCPIQGCKSEHAYADECSLGHQYSPDELINPISTLSGKAPARVPVNNWFFNLPAYQHSVEEALAVWEKDPACRKSLLNTVSEFLRKPAIYIKKEIIPEVQALEGIPPFTVIEEGNKSSWPIVFETLPERDEAVSILSRNGIRYRTSKTIVPFRLSGNVQWGIPVPEADGISGLTFWVWPESLWAPISFTKTYLNDGIDGKSYEQWWNSDDAKVYQFIGEDNIYFYAIAEIGLFDALGTGIKLPSIVPNYHLLYGKKKASSSSETKPPMAAELLEHYTPEQLRLHFMNASLNNRSVGFEPKAFLETKDNFDSVLYEGNLVINIFNRLLRSCFYTIQKYNDGTYPAKDVSPHILQKAEDIILSFERMMSDLTFDSLFEALNLYLRDANKEWAARSKTEDKDEMLQLLVDTFHVVRVATTLFHPIVPEGCEMIRDYLQVDERIWDWEHIFEPLAYFTKPNHTFKFLEPRVDFFVKHPSQLN